MKKVSIKENSVALTDNTDMVKVSAFGKIIHSMMANGKMECVMEKERWLTTKIKKTWGKVDSGELVKIRFGSSELNHMVYDGMWQRDLRHGPGTMIYPDKFKISCNWVNDFPEGSGKI